MRLLFYLAAALIAIAADNNNVVVVDAQGGLTANCKTQPESKGAGLFVCSVVNKITHNCKTDACTEACCDDIVAGGGGGGGGDKSDSDTQPIMTCGNTSFDCAGAAADVQKKDACKGKTANIEGYATKKCGSGTACTCADCCVAAPPAPSHVEDDVKMTTVTYAEALKAGGVINVGPGFRSTEGHEDTAAPATWWQVRDWLLQMIDAQQMIDTHTDACVHTHIHSHTVLTSHPNCTHTHTPSSPLTPSAHILTLRPHLSPNQLTAFRAQRPRKGGGGVGRSCNYSHVT
jgi:hypothetical protein